MSKFIYMEASPQLKGKARQYAKDYRKMAVVEVEDTFEGYPKMISERARGVVRVVDCTTAYIGSTVASYGYREKIRLKDLTYRLNKAKQYYATIPRKVRGENLWTFNVRGRHGLLNVYTLPSKQEAMDTRSAYTTWEDLKPVSNVSNVSQQKQLTLPV